MEDEKRKKIWERVFLGAIVGSAIFSVIGLAMGKNKSSKKRQESLEDKEEE